MSDLALYWNIASQPARAVKTLIDIGKIPCTFNHVNLYRQQQRKKQFLDMYPLGKVPVLTEGNHAIGQSGAIMIYICERYGHLAQFHGKTIEERAITNQYISWYQNYFRPFLIAPLRIYFDARKTKKPLSLSLRDNLYKGIYDVMDQLNNLMLINKTRFIAGDRVTIADFLFFYQLTNLIYYDISHQKYAQVARWYNEVYAISEVKAITHEWYQTAKKIKDIISLIEIERPKL